MEDKIRTLDDILTEKEIVLFGAGGYTQEVIELIGRDRVYAVLDSNVCKQGKQIDEFVIKSPSEVIPQTDKSVIFLISVASYNYEIARQLMEQWQIEEERIFSFTHLFAEKYMYDVDAIMNNRDKIEEAVTLMEDEESKEYLRNLVRAKLTRNPLYLKENICIKKPYYYQSKEWLISVRENDVILDCGAYIGDTARLFLGQTDEKCRVVCFEPLAGNYNKLCEWISNGNYQDKVVGVNALLGDKRGWANVHSPKKQSVQASLNSTGEFENTVKVEVLDDYIEEKISFIKMDIEGAEPEALRGAKKIIKHYCPRMVISAYHRTSHLWELPALIKKINPSYRIFCGHQPNAAFEPEFYVTM